MRSLRSNTAKRTVQQVREGSSRWRQDTLATEEPLEIRVYSADGDDFAQVAVTMRTPGHDFELAAGFLFTEGLLTHPDAIKAITYCTDPDIDGDQQYNIVNVYLRSGVAIDPSLLQRNFYATSSCGICGKASLDAVRQRGVATITDDFQVDGHVLGKLNDGLRAAQPVFDRTGGLHAAGLFDLEGSLLASREDVGRHNAVDKLIGHAFLGGRVPLRHTIMMVSGRASFEIVQKAAVAAIPMLGAVSAPSSLACDAADEFGITLVGFLRGTRFNVYTWHQRVFVETGDARRKETDAASG